MEENMRNWFRLFVVGAATPVLLKTRRNERLPMAIANGKSTIRSFLVATPLLAVSCTSVMVQTPQQMSDYAINIAKVDPTTDPKPQTLASDQLACANKARLQYPMGVDEAAIMTGSIAGGALGGAASGAAGTGNAGQATAAGAVGGVGQGGLNGMAQVKRIYVMQMHQQAIHNALCLVDQGHVVLNFSEQDMTCARVQSGCPKY
ncbi:MAG: hypothetical protein WBX30_32780 [Stellaceae bacterium]